MSVGFPIDDLTGNGVPSSRTLTINGVTYDLSANRSWTVGGGGGGSGTVTSVSMTVPTGLLVSGSPITTSGTLALTFASGYSIPTNVKQSNWDDAYTWVSAFPTQTGNAGKYLTTNGSALSWGTLSFVPTSRTLTINGTSFDLSSDRTWTIPTLSDGDKGDITVSGSGATWTIDNAVVTIAKINATGTASASTFLRGDGSWSTPTASAGGSTQQVQYNNGGSIAGAANVKIVSDNLTLVDAATPSTPSAGEIVVYADAMAGRKMMSFIDQDSNIADFQPALFSINSFLWLPGTGTTLAINWGASFTARNSGTGAAQAHPIRASTNAITSLNRATFSTGSTATGASGIQTSSFAGWIGNATGLGGWFMVCRFALEAGSGTYRVFVGLSANNAALASQPSTLANSIGIGLDSTDTVWQIMTNNGTTATRTTTGITVTTSDVFDFYCYVKPNGTTVYFEVRNAVTNAVLYTGNQSTNLPANTTFMYLQAHINSVTGTTPKLLALNKMYLETNL